MQSIEEIIKKYIPPLKENKKLFEKKLINKNEKINKKIKIIIIFSNIKLMILSLFIFLPI